MKRVFEEFIAPKKLKNMVKEITIKSSYTTTHRKDEKQLKERISKQRVNTEQKYHKKIKY